MLCHCCVEAEGTEAPDAVSQGLVVKYFVSEERRSLTGVKFHFTSQMVTFRPVNDQNRNFNRFNLKPWLHLVLASSYSLLSMNQTQLTCSNKDKERKDRQFDQNFSRTFCVVISQL